MLTYLPPLLNTASELMGIVQRNALPIALIVVICFAVYSMIKQNIVTLLICIAIFIVCMVLILNPELIQTAGESVGSNVGSITF